MPPGTGSAPLVALTGLQFLASERALPMAFCSNLCRKIWNSQKGRESCKTQAKLGTGVQAGEVQGKTSGLFMGQRT